MFDQRNFNDTIARPSAKAKASFPVAFQAIELPSPRRSPVLRGRRRTDPEPWRTGMIDLPNPYRPEVAPVGMVRLTDMAFQSLTRTLGPSSSTVSETRNG